MQADTPQNDESFYKHILDSITDACFVVDDAGCVLYANNACAFVTPLTHEELLGSQLLPGEVSPLLVQTLQTVQQGEGAKSLEVNGPILPNGVEHRYQMRIYPMGEQVVCIAHDVEGHAAAISQLHAQRELADALRVNAQTINSTLDLDSMIGTLLDQVARVIDYDMASLMIIEGDEARVIRSRGYDTPDLKAYITDFSIPLADAPNLRRMIATKEPLAIDDVTDDPLWIITDDNERMVRAYAGAPVMREGEVIGFLNLDSRRPSSFTAEDADRLAMFADQAGVAVLNAALYEQVQEQVHELESRNADLKVFAHAAAHDLRAPLQVILGMADLLAALDDTGLDEDTRIGLQTISEYAIRMEEIIQNLLSLAELQNNVIDLATVEPAPLIERVLHGYKVLTDVRGIDIVLAEGLPPVRAHASLLEQVFSNYIENAIKYIGSENPDPRIHIYAQTHGQYVRYIVADNGIGVPEGKREAIFEAFIRTHPEENKGHGLGLSIVRRIIKGMGGQVGVEESDMGGSAFWFELLQPSSQSTET
jgi:PAS domain S-box-containing protein